MMDTTATGSTSVETAVFFLDRDLSFLETLDASGEVPYNRVYFGHETCDRRMPTRAQMAAFLDSSTDSGPSLTLVTPVLVSEDGLTRITRLLEGELGARIQEIVVNDWGVLTRVREVQPKVRVAFGRWMNRCKRDPRVDGEGLHPTLRVDLGRSHYENALYRRFLLSIGVTRIEQDLLPQGLQIYPHDDGLAQSIYVGAIPVALSRLCMLGATSRTGRDRFDPDAMCRLECTRYAIRVLGQDCDIVGRAAYTSGGELTPELIRSVDRIVQVIS